MNVITLDYDIPYKGFKKTFRYQFLRFLRYHNNWKILYRKSSRKKVHIYINKQFGFFTSLLIRFLLLDDIERIKHDLKRYFTNREDYQFYTNRLFDKKIYFILTKKGIKIKEFQAGEWKLLS
jgi:hypothetical protein